VLAAELGDVARIPDDVIAADLLEPERLNADRAAADLAVPDEEARCEGLAVDLNLSAKSGPSSTRDGANA